MSTPASSKLRRFSKWSALTLLGLVLLAMILLVGASLVRQSTIEHNQERLRKNVDRVTAEICGGRDLELWFRERARGTNGWTHLSDVDRSLHDAETDRNASAPTPESRLHRALSELNDWKNGDWKPQDWDTTSEEVETEPGEERITRWLAETEIAAHAFAQAASCDVVAPQVKFMGSRVRDWAVAANGMLGRNNALRKQGRISDANAELLYLAQVWTKLACPTNVSEYRYGMVLALKAFAHTDELLVRGDISIEAAGTIEALEFDCESWLRGAVEGEAAWMAGNALGTSCIADSPSLLGWLVPPKTSGDSIFNDKQFTGTIGARYATPANLSREVNLAIEAALEALRSLDGGVLQPPEKLGWHQPSLFAIKPSGVYGCAVVAARLRLRQLSLALRILQVEDSDLLTQKRDVERRAARFRNVTINWDGDTVVLSVSPQLLSWVEAAKEAELGEKPKDPREMFKLFLGKDLYTLRVEPLARARKLLEGPED